VDVNGKVDEWQQKRGEGETYACPWVLTGTSCASRLPLVSFKGVSVGFSGVGRVVVLTGGGGSCGDGAVVGAPGIWLSQWSSLEAL
jgi:hypothetical protein